VLPALESESTALGAALLAGLQVGIWPDDDAVRQLTQSGAPYIPTLAEPERRRRLADWHRAVEAVVAFYRQEG
jgi:glycerol kinase